MKTVIVPGKRVTNPGALEASLKVDGFQLQGISSRLGDSPAVFVYLPDAEMKDPKPKVEAWVDPAGITVVSNKLAGAGGVPEAAANGTDKHILTIKKTDPTTGAVLPGSEQVQIIPTQLVVVSSSKPNLSNGQVTVEVGPSSMVGELTVKVCDPSGVMVAGSIRLRFA